MPKYQVYRCAPATRQFHEWVTDPDLASYQEVSDELAAVLELQSIHTLVDTVEKAQQMVEEFLVTKTIDCLMAMNENRSGKLTREEAQTKVLEMLKKIVGDK